MDPFRLDLPKEEVFQAFKKVAENSDIVDHVWGLDEKEYKIGFVRDNNYEIASDGFPNTTFVLFEILDSSESWSYYFREDSWTAYLVLPFNFIKYKLIGSNEIYTHPKKWKYMIGLYTNKVDEETKNYKYDIFLELVKELNLDYEKYAKIFEPDSELKETLKDMAKCCFGVLFVILMLYIGTFL